MTNNTRTSGLGTPPPGWLANCHTGARNAILQTFAGAGGDPVKPDRIRREITALCDERMLDPREWVSMALEGDQAAEAVAGEPAKDSAGVRTLTLSPHPFVRHL